MKFSLNIDADVAEPVVNVVAPKMTDQIQQLYNFVLSLDEDGNPGESARLVGVNGEQAVLLDFDQIIRIRTQDRQVLDL